MDIMERQGEERHDTVGTMVRNDKARQGKSRHCGHHGKTGQSKAMNNGHHNMSRQNKARQDIMVTKVRQGRAG